MIRLLRSLTDEELHTLIDIVQHEAVVEEVRHRFKKKYEEMAYSYYNNEYNLVGNITESTEKHSVYAYNDMVTELVAYIATLI